MVYDYDCIFNLHNYNQLYSSLHNYVYVHCISVILKWELEVIFFKPLRNQASDVETTNLASLSPVLRSVEGKILCPPRFINTEISNTPAGRHQVEWFREILNKVSKQDMITVKEFKYVQTIMR